MGGPAVTEENLANQIAVVKEEIRVNVLNRAVRRLPLADPPAGDATRPSPTRTTATARFDDLEQRHGSTTPATSSTRYYAPGNAVLAVAGDFEVDQAAELVERHFGAVPGAAVPGPARLRRAGPDRPSGVRPEGRLAPLPAVALGWRVPDPADLDAYLPYVVLAAVLRRRRRLAAAPPAGAGRPAWPPTSAATSA